jgi:hypothetical protein
LGLFGDDDSNHGHGFPPVMGIDRIRLLTLGQTNWDRQELWDAANLLRDDPGFAMDKALAFCDRGYWTCFRWILIRETPSRTFGKISPAQFKSG